MSDLAIKFMLMVESGNKVKPMEDFFEARAADFASLQMEAGVVVGEHRLVWTDHHATYMELLEHQLGVQEFCAENQCTDKDLMCSLEVLVQENPDVLMFVNSLISMSDYGGFLQLAYNVKNKQHCFHPHLTITTAECHGGDGHGHDHGHGGGGHGHHEHHEHGHHEHGEHGGDHQGHDHHGHEHHGHGHGHGHK